MKKENDIRMQKQDCFGYSRLFLYFHTNCEVVLYIYLIIIHLEKLKPSYYKILKYVINFKNSFCIG